MSNSKAKPNNTDKYVAKRIRTIRILRGLSQQQFAQVLDLSIQQIQKYEAGTNRISSGKLYDLAKFPSSEVIEIDSKLILSGSDIEFIAKLTGMRESHIKALKL